MGLDKENWNTKSWNPFKELISPGSQVLIKPNLVIDNSKNQETITTHPSIIRAIIDYVVLALDGEGEVIVGDAPLQRCNFNSLIKYTGLLKTISFFKSKNININLFDFRIEKILLNNRLNKFYKFIKTKKLKGDPNGYRIINLGKESNLQDISGNKGYLNFRVTNYDPYLMKKFHNVENHKYLISNSVLKSDVIINVPKIKTHRKAGITCCLKNVIGINGHKDWLPHHRVGSYQEGGDEYLKSNPLKKLLTRFTELEDILFIRYHKIYKILHLPIFFIKAIIHSTLCKVDKNGYLEGSWYGNDTIWRTIADLNQIIFYTDKKGKLTSDIQRKFLYFCDGIISGDSQGPLEPSPKKTGIIIGGINPLMIDLTVAELLNFNYKKIPQIYKLFKLKKRKISKFKPLELKIYSNYNNWNNKKINELIDKFNFQPSRGWKNYIEKNFEKLLPCNPKIFYHFN